METSHGQKESGITRSVTVKTITFIRWTRTQSTLKRAKVTRKDVYMSEPSKQIDTGAKPTPQTGKVNIDAAREGLAMVMDGLRVLQMAGARMTSPRVLENPTGGKILLFPMIEIPGHVVGFTVMENGKSVFTTDGVSVMERLPVMESGHGTVMDKEKE
jgi:hypothetical protein